MYRLICQKPAHFLSAQVALVSTFFQMFIVLGMYNFAQKTAKSFTNYYTILRIMNAGYRSFFNKLKKIVAD